METLSLALETDRRQLTPLTMETSFRLAQGPSLHPQLTLLPLSLIARWRYVQGWEKIRFSVHPGNTLFPAHWEVADRTPQRHTAAVVFQVEGDI